MVAAVKKKMLEESGNVELENMEEVRGWLGMSGA